MARTPSNAKPAVKSKRKLVDPFAVKYKAPPKGMTKSKSRGKYTIGSHGYKKKEQKYLGAMFKITVSGSTHESEHAIGYEPIARGLNERRGHGETARKLENAAPAYQEVATLHREHIGTGTLEDRTKPRFKTLDLTSTEYREYQRTLLEDGRIGDAIQLNQMGYAFDLTSRDKWKNTPEGLAASESYNRMIVHSDKVDYFDAVKGIATSKFSYQEKEEAFVARKIVEKKSYPDASQLAEYKEEFERRLTDRRMAEFKDEIDPLTDLPYSAYYDEIRELRKKKGTSGRSPGVSNDNAFSNNNNNTGAPSSGVFSLERGEEESAQKKAPKRRASMEATSDLFSLEKPAKKAQVEPLAFVPATTSASGTRAAEPPLPS